MRAGSTTGGMSMGGSRDIAADLSFDEIQIGDRASFRHTISAQGVGQFATLFGDFNPLHFDAEYAAGTPFGRPIVHGMFLASLFSRLVGMYIPGRRALYLSQSIDFVQPVHVGDEVEVVGEVKRKQLAMRALVIRTEIYALPDRPAVRGKAHVQVLERFNTPDYETP
jgi:acyl dehydratase